MESLRDTGTVVSGAQRRTNLARGQARPSVGANTGEGARLILFLVPPSKAITGGLLSIFSIAEVTRSFSDVHRSTVELCVYPGFPSYGHNELFDNDEQVVTLDEIVERGVPDYLQLHIPVDASDAILDGLEEYRGYLEAVPVLTVNLLNQNILLMPEPSAAARWFALTPIVTQTTAHDSYATQEVADIFAIPLYHLSAYLDPNQYERTSYARKSDIIVLSADAHPVRERIVDRLALELPQYQLVTVANMTYWEYKDLVARAKFCITFGEGFDGYYIEPIFSGGVSFSVYNDDFFPNRGFAEFVNVYPSYDDMARDIVDDIRNLEDEVSYNALSEKNFREIAKNYDFSRYVDNVRRFLVDDGALPPSPGSATRLLGHTASELATERTRHREDVASLHAQLDDMRRSNDEVRKNDHAVAEALRTEVERLTTSLTSLEATRLMRYSRPYRNIYGRIRRRVLG